MKGKPGHKRQAKRSKAKVAPKSSRQRPDAAEFERRRLAHDLELHQLELEVQNRSLRENQELLEASGARYAELYDGAPIGHLTLDETGVIREANLATAVLLGKDRRVLRDVPLRPLLAVASRRPFDAHLRACFKHRRSSIVELVVPLRGGGTRTVELMSAPRLVPEEAARPGRRAVVHSAMLDVSKRKHEEARRDDLMRLEHDARVLAESANRVKEEFLAVVSHELRAPLAPMMMWIKALRAGGAGDALRARAVDAIDACLKVQVSMIDDLVDVARGRHGKLRIERRPMDLHAAVSAALEAMAPSGGAKSIELALEVDAQPARLLGDATRLQQVVTNLLSNAIKFTPEGGHVSVSLHAKESVIELRVIDDGEGIEEQMLASIFEPFRQYDSSPARRHGGLGLGLSIVRQLVAQHEGQVVAASAGRGRGACFTVTLPRLRDGHATAGATEEVRTLSGVRILIVEDQVETREALSVSLTMYGADVTSAASAAEGRAALTRRRPDVLISDIAMPGEDGYTFIERLRSQEQLGASVRLPAVALTAHATEDDLARAIKAGFDRHVSKTVELERLVATIHALATPSREGALPAAVARRS